MPPTTLSSGGFLFAWFAGTTGTLGIASAQTGAHVATANQSELANKELTVTWSTVSGNLSKLVMTDKSEAGNLKAYNPAGQLVPATLPTEGGYCKVVEMTVKLTIANDELKAFAGQKADVKVSPGSRLKVAGSASDAYNATAGAAYTIGTLFISAAQNEEGYVCTTQDGDYAVSSEGVTYANVFVALSGDYDGETPITSTEGTTAPVEAKLTLSVTMGPLSTI